MVRIFGKLSIAMRHLATLLICLLAVARGQAQPGPPARANATGFAQGASLVSATSAFAKTATHTSSITAWSAEGLLDGNPGNGWCSAEGQPRGNQFVIELSEEYLIDLLRFDNECQQEYAGISARRVRVEASTEGPTAGYAPLGEYELRALAPAQEFGLPPTKARWLRLTVLDNHGHRQYTELMEFSVWGQFAEPEVASLPPPAGVWNTNWGWVALNLNAKGYLYGCYEFNQGTLEAVFTRRRVLEFRWDEGRQRGWATLVLNQEGTMLRGIWGLGNDRSQYGFWDFNRRSNQPNPCPNDQAMAQAQPTNYQPGFAAPASEPAPVPEAIRLEVNKPVVLNNVLFTQGTAQLLPGSFPELQKLLALLRERPTLRIELRGHTDNQGDPAKNLRLSEARVRAVREYLLDGGIAPARVAGKGFGGSQPVADNGQEATRRLNRRVEMVVLGL
jgi:outer membrane protein OmpA-like peptidoglycan-associated protein